ncbi:MAG: tetratricopeptide repeat protein [Alphaproteobacteria bacterium]|nr:tetratricopeptide repeat protein [Alphaproteobacteria bacterium]
MANTSDPAWSVNAAAIAALRLQQARTALERGDPQAAIVEAEELLDVEPDNPEALLLVGDAALEMADPPGAHAAYQRYVELHPDDPVALSGLAVACFELTLLEQCVEAAQKAVGLDTHLAESWYFLGMALERLGHPGPAQDAFRRAARLDPDAYPLVTPLSDVAWDAALDEAMQMLPVDLRSWYLQVPLRIEWYPTLADLRAVHPPLPPTSSALYDGVPPDEGDPWKAPPSAVRLYRGNLQRVAALEGDLPLRIAEALRHEALDWLALPADALPLSL